MGGKNLRHESLRAKKAEKDKQTLETGFPFEPLVKFVANRLVGIWFATC
jgi:hypothetical protein